MAEREIFIDLTTDLRIRYRRSAPPPPVSYAITLEVLEDGRWETIRLWDNAHDPDEHHEHVYRRADGKQPAVLIPHATVNAAMADAIGSARRRGREHMRQWKEES
ncbi:MAG TPA: hypothetical protein VHZ54_10455 [Solirubrobacterales bacterium]|nr:hypothetical protein [Solirubrobacterales bacterium]